jgi:2-dehydropantoate 2-reductase
MSMRVAIMGVGGVGGYFGGLLAESGADVVFIARGAHLKALQQDGLSIESNVRPLKNLPIQVTDDPASVAPADLVLLSVKLWDTDSALQQAKPLVKPGGAIASLQNGIEAVDKVTAVYGKAATLGGVAHIAALIEKPGVIRHNGTMAKVTLGEVDGGRSARLDAFAALAEKAKIELALPDDIHRAIWDKFVFLASFSGLTALTRNSIGPILAEPKTRALYIAALEEACAVARAKGVGLAADHHERALGLSEKLPGSMKASMLGDLERGNKLELPWLSGAVARLGAELGVPTPTHAFIQAALQLAANGRA